MPDSQARAARFETYRPHMLAVATRLLGSSAEAEDAVQEAWLRLDRAGDDGIANLGGWLTTVVSRVCLDHLRTRSARAEEPEETALPELGDDEPTPEVVAILSEATTEALAIVIDSLSPVERVAFVLHDVFDVPFEEIATIVDRTPAATRQMASRARRKARSAPAATGRATPPQREIVAAFFSASREGRLDALIQLLAPGVVLRADAATVRMGAQPEVIGARAVAETFSGRAQAARLATIDGQYGAVWAPGRKPRLAFRFTVEDGVIVAIHLVSDPEAVAQLTIVIDDSGRGRGAPRQRA
ncbi:MAG: sigma-70 family RNA polymerase sigma factor [Thermomicrobiales bacterium]|nr:sigma-70 family RNA polymerase sigma factor [Thermomicrobiales bacterium]